MLLQTSQNELQMMKMLFLRRGVDEDIVKIDNDEVVQLITKKVSHCCLKFSGCISEAKGHNEELVRAVS